MYKYQSHQELLFRYFLMNVLNNFWINSNFRRKMLSILLLNSGKVWGRNKKKYIFKHSRMKKKFSRNRLSSLKNNLDFFLIRVSIFKVKIYKNKVEVKVIIIIVKKIIY
jgi:hypothetical protein